MSHNYKLHTSYVRNTDKKKGKIFILCVNTSMIYAASILRVSILLLFVDIWIQLYHKFKREN